ncbi:MAG: transporter [Cytophagaceae bacterium BCCC1]|nr:MAG: transporter [Cytophagaceae bacterium BCCC1]
MKRKVILSIATACLLTACGKKTQETTPIRKDVIETVFASGILEAKNTYTLKALADGYLSAVNFEEGNIVNSGQLLAVVDNKESGFNQESAKDLYEIAQSNTQNNAPALLQAQNTIGLNKQKMEQDFVQSQRYKKLWEDNSIAKIDLENSELQYKTSKTNYESSLENYKQIKQQAEQQVISNKAMKEVNTIVLSKNQIKAQKSGKVYKKYKQIGDYVTRGEAIALIGESSEIYAKVNIDESNIHRIKVGQEALVQLNTNKDKTYRGTVAEIYPAFDENTQSFICKITFNEALDFSIVNTQLQSNITVATTKNALLIPRNFVDFGGNVEIKGKKEKVKITTKFASSDWVQVLSGITDNTILVTDNLADNKTVTSEVGSQLKP